MADSDSIFTDQDMTVQNYRSFSPLSLIAFVVSCAVSLIALVNYNLVFLAGVGVIFAVISIYKLIRRQGRSTGYVLSALALAMPLFSIAAPITYHRLRLKHLVETAIEYSETWLELVQDGKIHEPYELTLLRYQREKIGTDLAVARGPVSAPKNELQFYLKNEPEISIRADGHKGTLRRVGLVYYDAESKISVENFNVLYEYTRPDGDQRRFRLRMRRQIYDRGTTVYWNVIVMNIMPRESRIIYRPAVGGDESS